MSNIVRHSDDDIELIPYVPIDAEARGKVRQWRHDQTLRYEKLDAMLDSDEFTALASAFVSKKGIGRDRAWKKLGHLLRSYGAHLQWTHHGEGVATHENKYAVWALLFPGMSLTAPDLASRPDLCQDSVVVQYLIVGGRKYRGKLTRGVWSLEVPDHALMRLVQRDRNADIGKVILEAHNAALWMPYARAPKNTRVGFNLPAGKGVFMCRMYHAADHPETKNPIGADTQRPLVAIRPWSWLHHDQLTEGQDRLTVTRAQPGQKTMGDSSLLPRPLRLREKTDA